MAIRTIFAAASGGSASNGAMGLACQFAHRLNAHVEGFHVIPDRQTLFGADGEGFAMMNAALTDSLLEAGAANALKTRAGFDEIVKRHQLAKRNSPTLQHDGPSACWREETGYAPSLVASRAAFSTSWSWDARVALSTRPTPTRSSRHWRNAGVLYFWRRAK